LYKPKNSGTFACTNRMMHTMITYPNCKINIGLRIVRKREDGYHDLETIFYPIHQLHDILDVRIRDNANGADAICYTQTGIAVDCPPEQNLVVRCYHNMRKQYPHIGAVDVHLTKLIPFGAGLGGGSSDAAHMAIMLNELFQLGLSKKELAEIVRPMGADCPFFIYNEPCFATGIGERLTPIPLSLHGKRIVMVKPEVAVSTREAYSGVHKRGEFQHWQQAIKEGPCSPSSIAAEAFHNDFEDTIFAIHPSLSAIKQQLLDMGAQYAAMSGSGSTIFGLFDNNTESGTDTYSRAFDKDFAAMVILNDTL